MMIYLKTLGRVIWKSYFLVNFFVTMFFLYPVFRFLVAKEKRFKTAFKLTRWYGKYLIYSSGVRYEVILRKELPSPPFVICPNHTSYLDIIMLYCAFEKHFVFIGKQELSKVPLFNVFFKNKLNILVDRKSKISSYRSLIDLSNYLDNNTSVAIFPEGTVSVNAPVLTSFKNGPFKLAVDKNVPLIPVTFINNWNLFQRGSFTKGKAGPGKAKIIIDAAIIDTGNTDVDALREEVRAVIEKNLQPYL
jgi:1-acyl-sn-glycerol-3-phosphate acyltransferase